MPTFDVFHFSPSLALPIEGDETVGPYEWLLARGADSNDVLKVSFKTHVTIGVIDPIASMALSLVAGKPKHTRDYVGLNDLAETIAELVDAEPFVVFTSERNIHEVHRLVKSMVSKQRFIYLDGSDRSITILRDDVRSRTIYDASCVVTTHARAQKAFDARLLDHFEEIFCF